MKTRKLYVVLEVSEDQENHTPDDFITDIANIMYMHPATGLTVPWSYESCSIYDSVAELVAGEGCDALEGVLEASAT
jgi:hypothetical protein